MVIKNNPFSILLIILVSMSSRSAGQYTSGISGLSYYDSGGERGTTTFIYCNNSSTPYKAIWELEDGSRWSENYHTFDKSGMMLTKHRIFSDSITTDQTFSYDSRGRLVSETFLRSDGTEGSVIYVYDDLKLVHAECHGYNGWFHGTIEYLYDDQGNRLSANLLTSGNDQAGFITYSYDGLKRLIAEKWEFKSGAFQVYTYEYRNSNCKLYASSNVFMRRSCDWIIEKETYSYSGQESSPSFYFYNDLNQLLHKTYIRSDGLKTETDFYYDKSGLLESSVRKYSDGSAGTFRYSFDENGNMVKREFFRSDTLNGSEEYRYDDFGRLVEGRYLNVDSWLTGRLTFHHDRYDRIINAEYAGEPDLNASITFKYDEDSNLIAIDWMFENGLTQSYRFSYLRTTGYGEAILQ